MRSYDEWSRRKSNETATVPEPGAIEDFAKKSTRILLFLLLLLVVAIILVASIVFTTDTRVFLLKFVAAALLAIIPGWIYLQFIRNKGPSLYDEYVLNLFRLRIDELANLPAPPKHTSYFRPWSERHREIVEPSATDNLYRRKFESVYGRPAVSTLGLFKNKPLTFKERTETFAPVVMATIMIALGWALILQPEVFDDINLRRIRFPLTGQPELPADPLKFGFLGAYAFIILDLARRYYRDDLKSTAYLSAATRIIFASTLIVAMDATGFDSLVAEEQANLVAFFIGFFPRAGFTWLRTLLPGKLQASIPALESDYPLRELEGLNIWYESRLIEEGMESMQNLCTCSLVDLMLKTRIPVARLVDWLDQAFLYLHLPKDPNAPEGPPPHVARLRSIGVRTATDFERIWKQAQRPSNDGLRALIGKAFNLSSPEEIDGFMASVSLSLKGEPNLWHVRAYRELEWLRHDQSPWRLIRNSRLREFEPAAPNGGSSKDVPAAERS